jgi:hypothetical protein
MGHLYHGYVSHNQWGPCGLVGYRFDANAAKAAFLLTEPEAKSHSSLYQNPGEF